MIARNLFTDHRSQISSYDVITDVTGTMEQLECVFLKQKLHVYISPDSKVQTYALKWTVYELQSLEISGGGHILDYDVIEKIDFVI